MDRHERMLIAFLAGDLAEPASREWDEHLLRCERCWRAVREDRAGRAVAARLREPAPPELAERVGFAVELAVGPARRRSRQRRSPRWILAVGGALVVAVIAVGAVVWPHPRQPADPPVIAAVAQVAQGMTVSSTPSSALSGTAPAAPVPVGTPVAMVVDSSHLTWRYYRLGGVEAAVITADRSFPMPTGAHALTTGNTEMAWTATRGRVALYCPSGEVLIAAPVPVSELPGLAARLPVN